MRRFPDFRRAAASDAARGGAPAASAPYCELFLTPSENPARDALADSIVPMRRGGRVGRRRSPAKRVYGVELYRGFESLPLRQKFVSASQKDRKSLA